MKLSPVKLMINENTVKALKSLVYASFHCMHLTASVYKQVLRICLTVNMRLITIVYRICYTELIFLLLYI